MNTKIVYVLVCGEKDIYLSQAAISAFSARRHNPDAQILLVVDYKTSGLISRKENLTKDFNDVVVVNVPEELSKIQKSRYLKTTLRHHIKGDYLFIDTDTIIVDSLSEIDYTNGPIAAVLDRHVKIEDNSMRKWIENDLKKVGLTVEDTRQMYFNSGVMFVKDVPESYSFYDRWYTYWNEARQHGNNVDQPPLAKVNKDFNFMIQELDGSWNCQMVENFVNYLNRGKILHYFATHHESPYQLYDDNLMLDILAKGYIGDEIKEKLERPKELFRERHLLVYNKDVEIYRTSVHSMFLYHRWIFNIFEYFSWAFFNRRLF